MEKTTKITFSLFAAALVSMVIHNTLYGIWRLEEPVFFLLSLTLFLGFVVSVVWNLVTYKRYGWPKEIWKVGFIGAFGILGVIPGLGANFFAFFVLFGLFILRK